MSLRYEQYRALQITRDFLRGLIDPRKTKRIPSEIRKRAYRCLRHYPFLNDVGRPMFSHDTFNLEEEKE